MKRCSNETCSRQAARKYCSRECQLSARFEGTKGGRHRRQLPDLWIDMDLYWLLVERADVLNLTVRDVALNAIEAEVGYPVESELFPESA